MTLVSPHLDAIRPLLEDGLTNPQIATRLGISRQAVWRVRKHLGLPDQPPPHLPAADSIEDAFHARTQDAGDGHLEWTGTRGANGTATLTHAGRDHTAGRVAFRIHHGREPEGTVKPECGRHGCVEPGHVEDAPGRARARGTLRLILGLPAPAEHCANGHDQAQHGRFDADGHAYCGACQVAAKARSRARQAAAA